MGGRSDDEDLAKLGGYAGPASSLDRLGRGVEQVFIVVELGSAHSESVERVQEFADGFAPTEEREIGGPPDSSPAQPLEMAPENASVTGKSRDASERAHGFRGHDGGYIVANRPGERPLSLGRQVAGADELGQPRKRLESDRRVRHLAGQLTTQSQGRQPRGRNKRHRCQGIGATLGSDSLDGLAEQH